MPTSITYTKQTTVDPNVRWNGNSGGYRLIMAVTAAVEISPKIFIFQKRLVSDGAEDFDDFFYSVATVAELATVNADAPAQGDTFYRVALINLIFGNFEVLQAELAKIERAISDLSAANNEFNTLAAPVSVTA